MRYSHSFTELLIFSANSYSQYHCKQFKNHIKTYIKDHGYTLEKLKIYLRKFYGPYNDLLQYSPFTSPVWPRPLLMCVTYTGFDLTGYDGYTLDSTAVAWPQQVTFPLLEHLFTHLGLLECSCCLECNIYSRICNNYGLMIFD